MNHRLCFIRFTYLSKKTMTFVFDLSIDEIFEQQTIEKLNSKCQSIDIEIELDRIKCFREIQKELNEQCEMMKTKIVKNATQSMRHESFKSKIQIVSIDMMSRM